MIPEYRRRYDEAKMPLPANYLPLHPFDNGALTIRDEKLAAWPRSEGDIRKHLTDYYGVITYLDGQIGRILQALDESGQGANTIVIFSSDHGLAIGSHGLMGKQNIYEDGMKVPLIIAGPGLRRGTSAAFVYLYDLFPTICDLVGIDGRPRIHGQSFGPVIEGKSETAREAVLLAFMESQRAIREADWKLIRYPQVNITQLFDLQRPARNSQSLRSASGKGPRTVEKADGHAASLRRYTALNRRDPAQPCDHRRGTASSSRRGR